jgi:hypothetical protein
MASLGPAAKLVKTLVTDFGRLFPIVYSVH